MGKDKRPVAAGNGDPLGVAADAANAARASDDKRMPWPVFAVAMAWTALLVAAFAVWITVHAVPSAFPATLGPLPITTIWFAAVGGLLVSLTGIYDHNRDWDPRFDYWHYTRPLLGAFIGVLGCLVLVVLTEASTDRAISANATFYSVTALVIGYREETFRTLVMRLTDTLLASDGTRAPDRPQAGAPAAADGRSAPA